ncbi:T9SS type A sorting domain-containing protein [Chryseobacterium caseinilyticum]|uniref:T9SS type A sorting domain-containing protein n=1 Tax=Chryseobacterium caseinilyticum TaxID=2771428 RepID=A0ABR8ZFN9_9FLAO|nr:T9SS type A sorting domain-containing protein [Chryseobacterium caseinilyticum]MBD8083623.1 T9SS type A sorting domain-containing protein [Chryseobacterium caseinilyticum]
MDIKFYFRLLFLLLPFSIFSQTYTYQWAKHGGGSNGSGSAGLFSEIEDEMIRDIAVDSENNHYYLSSLFDGTPVLEGQALTHYANRDLVIFSTDCSGNIRWTRTIGGSQNGEYAWKLKVDNNGGLYVMANVTNVARTVSTTNTLPIRFDDNNLMPFVTAPADPSSTVTDPALKTAFLLKYNTSNGNLVWQKPLQGDVSNVTRMSDNGLWCLDNANNIHAIIGFRAGTHLNGQITVPSSYTNDFQYYLVKFSYSNGDMVISPNPILLPVTGSLRAEIGGGKIQMLYDEALNRYYIAGSRSSSVSSYLDFSYNNIPFTKDGFMLAINGSTGSELWRKEINSTYAFPDDKIYSLIKDENSNLYISGRFFSLSTAPVTFGDYTFPTGNSSTPFVMKLNSSGSVQWSKIPDGLSPNNTAGYRFMRGPIVLNGNEIAFAKGSRSDIWGSYAMNRPAGDLADPMLIRLNKDSGAVIGASEIQSNFGYQDEFTAVSVDNDGNYVLGGFYHNQLFTDPSDNINTILNPFTTGKSQFFIAKLAKSVCSNLSVEETAVDAGLQFYPNPVQDLLTIKSKNKLESYEVYSSAGQTVLRGSLGNNNAQINMSALTAGVYYVKVKTEKAVVTEKVVKK